MYGWNQIEKNPTWRAMQRVRGLTVLVVTGKKHLQMFCSPPGLGKTETVLEVFAEYNLVPHYTSPTNAAAFCRDLWLHREAVLFLDDCDTLARSEPCANIAKMVWGPQRLVVVPATIGIQKNEQRRLEDSQYYDPNIPPPTFRVGDRHGVIWNSNKDFTDPKTVSAEMAADFHALVSRGLDPFLVPGEPQAVFDYTIWMILNGMLRRHPQGDARGDRGGFKLIHQQEILDFFCTHGRRLKEISPRMGHKLAMARRNDPDWEQAWQDQLAPHALWGGLILPDTPPKLLSPAMRWAMQPPQPDPDPTPPPAARQPAPEPPAPSDPYAEFAAASQKLIVPQPMTNPPIPKRRKVAKNAEPLVLPDVICLPDQRLRPPAGVAWECWSEHLSLEAARDLVTAQSGVWDIDDFDAMATAPSDWSIGLPDDVYRRASEYHLYCPRRWLGLYYTADGVLELDKDTYILTVTLWPDLAERLAPAIERQRLADVERERQTEARNLLTSKLPPKRKLAKVRQIIDRLIALDADRSGSDGRPKISPEGQAAITYIRAMKADDPAFAECRSFTQYIDTAAGLAKLEKKREGQ